MFQSPDFPENDGWSLKKKHPYDPSTCQTARHVAASSPALSVQDWKSSVPRVLARAAVTKRHRWGFKAQTRISHHLGGWEVQDQGPAGSVPGEAPSPSLQTPASLLCPFLTRAPSPSPGPHPHDQRPHLRIPSHWGFGLLSVDFAGTQT